MSTNSTIHLEPYTCMITGLKTVIKGDDKSSNIIFAVINVIYTVCRQLKGHFLHETLSSLSMFLQFNLNIEVIQFCLNTSSCDSGSSCIAFTLHDAACKVFAVASATPYISIYLFVNVNISQR